MSWYSCFYLSLLGTHYNFTETQHNIDFYPIPWVCITRSSETVQSDMEGFMRSTLRSPTLLPGDITKQYSHLLIKHGKTREITFYDSKNKFNIYIYSAFDFKKIFRWNLRRGVKAKRSEIDIKRCKRRSSRREEEKAGEGRDEHVSASREPRGNRKQGHRLRGEVTAGGMFGCTSNTLSVVAKIEQLSKAPQPTAEKRIKSFHETRAKERLWCTTHCLVLHLALLCLGMTQGQRDAVGFIQKWNTAVLKKKELYILLSFQSEKGPMT